MYRLFAFVFAFGFCCVPGLHSQQPQRLGARKLVLPPANAGPETANSPVVIDNESVARIAGETTFAAIASVDVNGGPESSDEMANEPTFDQSKTREKWGKRHRREVKTIRSLQNQISKAMTDLAALKDRFFHASSEKQRIRIEPRLKAQKQKLSKLRDQLSTAKISFSQMIREARKEGAQPGWFRDLPRP